MTTAEQYIANAEMFAAAAEEWENADTGWKGALTTQERLARRSLDLSAAQVHATLAQTAVAREYLPSLQAAVAALQAAASETKPGDEVVAVTAAGGED
jgi:hypothetical protein